MWDREGLVMMINDSFYFAHPVIDVILISKRNRNAIMLPSSCTPENERNRGLKIDEGEWKVVGGMRRGSLD